MSANNKLFSFIVSHAHNVALTEKEIGDFVASHRFTPSNINDYSQLEKDLIDWFNNCLELLKFKLEKIYIGTQHCLNKILDYFGISIYDKSIFEARKRKKKKKYSFGAATSSKDDSDIASAISDLFDSNGFGSHSSLFGSAGAKDKFIKYLLARTKRIIDLEKAKGTSTQNIIRIIQDKIGTPKDWRDIARTEVQRINNAAILDSIGRNNELFLGLRFTAILDSRTCPRCAKLDGKIYWYNPTEQQLSIKVRPDLPIHPRCRCTYVPILKSKKEIEAIYGENPKLDEKLDGEIPSSMTYQEWIDSLDEKEKIRALGRERYEAYKRGVTLDQFAEAGRVLNSDDLKNINPGRIRKTTTIRAIKSDNTVEELIKRFNRPISVYQRQQPINFGDIGAQALKLVDKNTPKDATIVRKVMTIGDTTYFADYEAIHPPKGSSKAQVRKWIFDIFNNLNPLTEVISKIDREINLPISHLTVFDIEEGYGSFLLKRPLPDSRRVMVNKNSITDRITKETELALMKYAPLDKNGKPMLPTRRFGQLVNFRSLITGEDRWVFI